MSLFAGGLPTATPMGGVTSGRGAKRPHIDPSAGSSSGPLTMMAVLQAVREDPGIQALATNQLRTSAEMRTVKAQIFDVFIGSADAPAMKETKAGGTAYFETVKRMGKNHNQGSPHKHQAEKLVNYMHSKAKAADNKEHLESIGRLVAEYPSVDALGRAVPTLRTSQTYEKKARMMIGWSHEAKETKIHLVLRAMMAEEHCEFKEGEAPQNHMERSIRELFGIGREAQAAFI